MSRMPELPEVEILARHLRPRLVGRRVSEVLVLRPKAIRPLGAQTFAELLRGGEIRAVGRRAKFLRFEFEFEFRGEGALKPRVMLGHLGMTGRMYLRSPGLPWAKHASVVLDLGGEEWVFEDPRQFGGLSFDERRLDDLGPEPLDAGFTAPVLRSRLAASCQAIKVRLMDQSVLAGLGNIYASEALHVAGIAPHREARSLKEAELRRLCDAIREVLEGAIRTGESATLNFSGDGGEDRLFYFGRSPGDSETVAERFRVYDREGQPCLECSAPIERTVLGGRSTYACRRCQP